ncbi:MAG: RagB/SusD family nutrient uptake outer membrane protein [Prolixibacteraceae bacterium]
MRKKINTAIIAVILVVAGCKESWLEPDPLSFFEPGNAFTTPEGLQAALTTCERNMRYCWYGDGAPVITELLFSEVAVEGTTDKTGPAQDLNKLITPTANLNSADANKIGWFWYEGYKGIKYANTVISRVGTIPGLDEELRDDMLGQAYFHRAWKYYHLCFQFGDVPYISEEVTRPKLDFRSTKYEVILEQMIKDLEFAVEHVGEVKDAGHVTKGTCQHLLAKYYLATGEFDKAIAMASNVIDGGRYSLMTERFGVDKGDASRNVTWDLHRPANKSIAANREMIFNVISREELENSRQSSELMRQAVPFFLATNANKIYTPSGKVGLSNKLTAEIDLRKMYGRGIGRARNTWYHTHMIWDDENDLRHAPGNWMRMEDLVYNHPDLKSSGDPYYGKPLQLFNGAGTVLTTDTIRNWYDWPHYKVYFEDPKKDVSESYNGGAGDMYVYRLAETYLIRAEAWFWKGDLGNAANDLNAVRTRAGAAPYDAGDINIGTILDERARELYWEEFRHVELVRIARLLAMTGKADENGKTYSAENFSGENYWYNRIIGKTEFYNKGAKTVHGDFYTMSPYHVLWPIPQGAIDSNTRGRLNQNFGYDGYDLNETPIDNIEEAISAQKE